MLDMPETIEDLEDALQNALNKIDNIAAQVAEKQMDAYEGFMATEKYKDEIIEIGNKLKEKGIDISTLTQ